MTIRHLQIFIAVCETMNMTHAARQLHISHPLPRPSMNWKITMGCCCSIVWAGVSS